MKETITSYIGLDIHKDSIAIAVAEAGRSAPRFIGTTPPGLATLCKALTRCTKRNSTLGGGTLRLRLGATPQRARLAVRGHFSSSYHAQGRREAR